MFRLGFRREQGDPWILRCGVWFPGLGPFSDGSQDIGLPAKPHRSVSVSTRFKGPRNQDVKRELMYDYITSVRNQPPFLFTTSALDRLNLHLTSRRASERIFYTIIEKCN